MASGPDRGARVEFLRLGQWRLGDEMLDPKSESLAAVHFKYKYIPDKQCYVCHTAYGMTGAVSAKMERFIEVYKYFTRTYPKILSMREPYRNAYCLKCHVESVIWLKHDEHVAARDDLL